MPLFRSYMEADAAEADSQASQAAVTVRTAHLVVSTIKIDDIYIYNERMKANCFISPYISPFRQSSFYLGILLSRMHLSLWRLLGRRVRWVRPGDCCRRAGVGALLRNRSRSRRRTHSMVPSSRVDLRTRSIKVLGLIIKGETKKQEKKVNQSSHLWDKVQHCSPALPFPFQGTWLLPLVGRDCHSCAHVPSCHLHREDCNRRSCPRRPTGR